jgi:hypothetical protein
MRDTAQALASVLPQAQTRMLEERATTSTAPRSPPVLIGFFQEK